MDRVGTGLILAWEDAYRRYSAAAGPNVVETSRAVACAWRELETAGALPWWLRAAVRSAAEAFEQQARSWEAESVRVAPRSVRTRIRCTLAPGTGEHAGVRVPHSREPGDAATPQRQSTVDYG
ncbi:hypothetical protein [Amycolatopsis pithecellobii]|uniref:Uncharacterized protein n=1 Tax=Amycolatopsis pithecellobii TaxID=664692 RepID=A0A6N7Z368_9PSEU|nr:hypothetical protein [Amycolatopsis pithecellobii]MTD54510.1 hypothetical protein [Amycolatopsis pithecellobii]